MMLLRLITKKMSSSVVAFGLGSTEKLREVAVSAGVGWRMEMKETESREPKIFSTHKIQLNTVVNFSSNTSHVHVQVIFSDLSLTLHRSIRHHPVRTADEDGQRRRGEWNDKW